MSERDPILARAFAAGRAEVPSSTEGKQRTLAALGLSAARTSSPPNTPRQSAEAVSSRRSSRRLFDWRWWSLGAVALVAIGAARSWRDEAPAGASSPVVIARPAAIEAPPVAKTLLPEAADGTAPMIAVTELPSAPPPAEQRANIHVQPAPLRSGAPSTSTQREAPAAPSSQRETVPPAAQTSSLREEVEALGQASRALSERRCVGARAALADYRARFPNGRLEREADVVDIEIAGRGGDVERARASARRFVARFPGSPYAMRLGPWLGEDGADRGVVRCLDASP